MLGNAGYRGYLALAYELTEQPLTVVPKLLSKMQSAIRGILTSMLSVRNRRDIGRGVPRPYDGYDVGAGHVRPDTHKIAGTPY